MTDENIIGERDVLFEERGRALIITLNRPKALNALSLEMSLQIEAAMDQAAANDELEVVVIRGAGGKALCAGGDIRRLYDEGRAGGRYPYEFYANEYRLNAKIFHYPKPYVALMDGIVMGGGVGLSVTGRWRVVTERLKLAMPETAIGLFPDVGGGHFLSRLPGEIGLYMALTGARLTAADAVYAEIGDVMVPSDKLDDLVSALSAGGDVEATIRSFAEDTGEPALAAHREAIDEVFSADTVEEILARLDARDDEWSAKTAKTMRVQSPISLKITLRQLREGATKTFNECMVMEYRMACGCAAGHDFYEGVRSVVIDKDHAPKWQPATVEEVSDAEVATYFDKEPADGDLDDLPTPTRD